jgi:hypothetical protein
VKYVYIHLSERTWRYDEEGIMASEQSDPDGQTHGEIAADRVAAAGDFLGAVTLAEIRRGRSLDLRLELGRRIVDICAEVLGVPKRTVLVEFTLHTGDEILRDGAWTGEWTAVEASSLPNDTNERS